MSRSTDQFREQAAVVVPPGKRHNRILATARAYAGTYLSDAGPLGDLPEPTAQLLSPPAPRPGLGRKSPINGSACTTSQECRTLADCSFVRLVLLGGESSVNYQLSPSHIA
jgi:hypothetical protein